MLLKYVDYLNNLRDSISVSFGNTGELLEAYKLTALLLFNYAVMTLIGLLVCWVVCKFISAVTFHAIKFGIKFDGVYSDDDEIADKFRKRAIKVSIITESLVLLSYWFLTPTWLFLFPSIHISDAKFNSMLVIMFIGIYTLYIIWLNWYILAKAEVVKASIKPLTDSVYKDTNSALSKCSIFEAAAYEFAIFVEDHVVAEIVNWALEEKIGRREFEKRLKEKLIDIDGSWKYADIDIFMTRGRRKTLRKLCS